MDKSASHYAIALTLYPVLYVLTTWYKLGEFLPTWFPWTLRTLFIGAVTLTLLWFLPLKPSSRAALYVLLMALGGILVTIWMNKGLLASEGFGWPGMFRQFAYSQPRFFGCALIVALLLSGLHALSRPRVLSPRQG